MSVNHHTRKHGKTVNNSGAGRVARLNPENHTDATGTNGSFNIQGAEVSAVRVISYTAVGGVTLPPDQCFETIIKVAGTGITLPTITQIADAWGRQVMIDNGTALVDNVLSRPLSQFKFTVVSSGNAVPITLLPDMSILGPALSVPANSVRTFVIFPINIAANTSQIMMI